MSVALVDLDADRAKAAVEAAVERFGGIDVLIANAGVAPATDTVRSADSEAFERTIEIDLDGVWRTVRAGLPAVIERRAARVVAPGWMHALLAIRRVIGPLEARLGRDPAVAAAIEEAEKRLAGATAEPD